MTRSSITHTLSLDSLRRQLEVYETALDRGDGYHDWLDGADDAATIPIMKSLRSPTTRALTSILESREAIKVVQWEIDRAVAEGAAMKDIVTEAERLQKEPLLQHFKGSVAVELHTDAHNAEEEVRKRHQQRGGGGGGGVPECTASGGDLSGTLQLSAEGIITVMDPQTNTGVQPILLRDGEVPRALRSSSSRPTAAATHRGATYDNNGENGETTLDEEEDELEQRVVSQIVFAMPRDAAGDMLELMPSAILTRAAADRSASNMSALENYSIQKKAKGTRHVARHNGETRLDEVLIDSTLLQMMSSASPQQRNNGGGGTLREMLQEQRELTTSHTAQDALYRANMAKYGEWQLKREELLDHFTAVENASPTTAHVATENKKECQ